MKRTTKRRLRRNAYDEDALMLEDAVASGSGTAAQVLDALRGSAAGLARGQRETLALVAKTFPGGESFARSDLAREIASQFRGARGQRVSVATGSIEASKALRALEGGGFVVSLGGEPERFTLTEHGEHTALGARLAAAEDFADKTLEAELARYEADEEAFRRRLPSGPRTRTVVEPHAAKRPPCRLCKHEHSLKAHRSHRVDGARHRVTLTGQRLAEDMALTLNPTTLADAMETWARNLGLKVPARGSAAWKGLFTAWERHGMRANPDEKRVTRLDRLIAEHIAKDPNRALFAQGLSQVQAGMANESKRHRDWLSNLWALYDERRRLAAETAAPAPMPAPAPQKTRARKARPSAAQRFLDERTEWLARKRAEDTKTNPRRRSA